MASYSDHLVKHALRRIRDLAFESFCRSEMRRTSWKHLMHVLWMWMKQHDELVVDDCWELTTDGEEAGSLSESSPA